MAGRTSARNLSIDASRGLIMVVMALDHASAFIARRHSSEFWGGLWTRYDSLLPFLTRFVTHLCAPGFFFLMGNGLTLFALEWMYLAWLVSLVPLYWACRQYAQFKTGQPIDSMWRFF